MTIAWICVAMIAGTPTADSPPTPEVNRAYEDARAQAGRSSEDQVRLALWCEAHGLTARRLHHLTLAVLADPRNSAARGLMGLIAHDGRWLRPEALADKLKADPDRTAALAEYGQKRLKAAYTADAQWALGVWCDEHGLKDQAKAHLTAVTRLDPNRESAWKRLGYKKHDGRWITDAQNAAEKAEAEAQKAADKKWKSLLERYKAMLDRPAERQAAEAALADVTDPRAVPTIGRVFAATEATQPRAVRLLGQVESPAASKALAYLAVFSDSPEARRSATETLRGRDSREYLGPLIALIRDPIKYEVKPVGGPGSPGVLFVEGKRAKVRRVYSPPPSPSFSLRPGDRVEFDADGLPVVIRYGLPYTLNGTPGIDTFTPGEYTGQVAVSADRAKVLRAALATPGDSYEQLLAKQAEADRVSRRNLRGGLVTVQSNRTVTAMNEIDIPIGRMMAESRKVAIAAQEQLADDVRAIEGRNVSIKEANSRVRSVLMGAIGQDLGDDREAWDRMWVDRQGYAFHATSTSSVPTMVEDVPLNYQATPIGSAISIIPLGSKMTATATLPLPASPPHFSCFAAGTLVRTIDGDCPIELVRAGDVVLVQDTHTGGLAYQAAVTAYHNPPNSTLRINFGSESIVATGIHRFWKAGKGWTMARDLKVGDLVRTLDGVARVEAIDDDRVQPVFNLEVAEGNSFLVGKLGALVHDNSLVEPTPAPFDTAGLAK